LQKYLQKLLVTRAFLLPDGSIKNSLLPSYVLAHVALLQRRLLCTRRERFREDRLYYNYGRKMRMTRTGRHSRDRASVDGLADHMAVAAAWRAGGAIGCCARKGRFWYPDRIVLL